MKHALEVNLEHSGWLVGIFPFFLLLFAFVS